MHTNPQISLSIQFSATPAILPPIETPTETLPPLVPTPSSVPSMSQSSHATERELGPLERRNG
jgi:hypothetical protein